MLLFRGSRSFFKSQGLQKATKLLLTGEHVSMEVKPPKNYRQIWSSVQCLFPDTPLGLKDPQRGIYLWGNDTYTEGLDKAEEALQLEVHMLSKELNIDINCGVYELDLDSSLSVELQVSECLDKAIEEMGEENYREGLNITVSAIKRFKDKLPAFSEEMQTLLSLLGQLLSQEEMWTDLEALAVFVLSNVRIIEEFKGSNIGTLISTYADYLQERQLYVEATELYDFATSLMESSDDSEACKAIIQVESGKALFKLNRTVEAEAVLTECLEKVSSDDQDSYFTCLCLLTTVSLINGNLELARQTHKKLEDIVRLIDDDIPFEFNIMQAQFYLKEGLLDKAQFYLSIAVSNYPDLEESKLFGVQLALVGVEHAKGNLAKAKLMLADLDFPTVHHKAEKLYYFANIEADYGNYDEALAFIEQGNKVLEEVDGDSSDGLAIKLNILKADLLLIKDMVEEAKSLLESLLLVIQNEANMRFEEAQIVLALGKICAYDPKMKASAADFINQAYVKASRGLGQLHSFMFACKEVQLKLRTNNGEDTLSEALEILKAKQAALGPSHPYLLCNLVAVGELLLTLKGPNNVVQDVLEHADTLVLRNQLSQDHIEVKKLRSLKAIHNGS